MSYVKNYPVCVQVWCGFWNLLHSFHKELGGGLHPATWEVHGWSRRSVFLRHPEARIWRDLQGCVPVARRKYRMPVPWTWVCRLSDDTRLHLCRAITETVIVTEDCCSTSGPLSEKWSTSNLWIILKTILGWNTVCTLRGLATTLTCWYLPPSLDWCASSTVSPRILQTL